MNISTELIPVGALAGVVIFVVVWNLFNTLRSAKMNGKLDRLGGEVEKSQILFEKLKKEKTEAVPAVESAGSYTVSTDPEEDREIEVIGSSEPVSSSDPGGIEIVSSSEAANIPDEEIEETVGKPEPEQADAEQETKAAQDPYSDFEGIEIVSAEAPEDREKEE